MPEKVVVKRCDPGKYQKKTRIYFSVEFTALLMNLTNVLKKTRRLQDLFIRGWWLRI